MKLMYRTFRCVAYSDGFFKQPHQVSLNHLLHAALTLWWFPLMKTSDDEENLFQRQIHQRWWRYKWKSEPFSQMKMLAMVKMRWKQRRCIGAMLQNHEWRSSEGNLWINVWCSYGSLEALGILEQMSQD